MLHCHRLDDTYVESFVTRLELLREEARVDPRLLQVTAHEPQTRLRYPVASQQEKQLMALQRKLPERRFERMVVSFFS